MMRFGSRVSIARSLLWACGSFETPSAPGLVGLLLMRPIVPWVHSSASSGSKTPSLGGCQNYGPVLGP